MFGKVWNGLPFQRKTSDTYGIGFNSARKNFLSEKKLKQNGNNYSCNWKKSLFQFATFNKLTFYGFFIYVVLSG